MMKSRRHIYKKHVNKTRKNKITFLQKKKFIEEILKEWKKQTRGHYEKDKLTIYKDDYYLSFSLHNNFYNHVHLILKDFNHTHNNHNNIIYVIKKMDTTKKNKIVHSKEIKINVFSEPKKVVRHMIQRYNEFTKL